MSSKRFPALLATLPWLLASCGDASSDADSDTTQPDASGGGGDDAALHDAPPGDEAAPDATPGDDAAALDAAGPDGAEGGEALPGFIGSPCATSADCKFDGAVCLTDGFPAGLCTLPCSDSCPDQNGFPVTFCGNTTDVPEGGVLGDGLCLSRCDFEYYPDDGCRDGYGCVLVARPSDPAAIRYACVPNRAHELDACYFELAARGVGFEPTYVQDETPDGNPNLHCHVEAPLYVKSPVHGVALHASDGTTTRRVLAACKMAGALVSTIDDVKPVDVVALRHMGTYNCRVIAGTTTLSQHSYGLAIDIAGFEFLDGRLWTVFDDWEHNTTTPQTEAGAFLYDAVHRWYDAWYWNIILTPNYNADHDDHFHVDLTEGSHFLKFHDGRYIGPAPYAD